MKAKKSTKPKEYKTSPKDRERFRNYRLENPDAYRIWHAENRVGTFEKKIKDLIKSSKARSKIIDVEHSISEKDFTPVTHCPLLGIKLNFASVGKGYHCDSPSIDRIDSSKGYVPGNVWVISSRANRMKSDATIEELQMLVANLTKIWGGGK